MKRIITLSILMIWVGSVSFAKTIEVPVSQIALITPGIRNQDPAMGPRLCVKFEIPENIRGVEIGYADLVIHQTLPVISNDSLALFEAFALQSNWNEAIRWNDFPIAGGDVDSNFYAAYTHRCGADSIISLDITSMAQNWNDHRESNFGLLIIPRTTDWNAFREFTPQLNRLRGLISLRILVPGRQEE
jgi:hypothetical protein